MRQTKEITMLEQAQARLAELENEYRMGEGQLRELTARESALRETLLRISGAIQVLQELMAAAADGAPGRHEPPDTEGSARVRPDTLTVP